MLNELDQKTWWEDSESLFRVLEEAGRAAKAATQLESELKTRSIKQAVIDDFITMLGRWPIPGEEWHPERLDTWLPSVERLGLTRRGLERLRMGPAWMNAVLAALVERLERLRLAIRRRSDRALFAGMAEEATRSPYARDIEPWKWLKGGELAKAIGINSKLLDPALQRWVAGKLHTIDAQDLRAQVEAKEEVREAYRHIVRQLAKEVYVTRWNPEWSLDVATSDSEIPNSRKLLSLLLPHANRRVEVRQHCRGTWWSFSDNGSGGEIVPWGSADHVWIDELLGEIRTLVREENPSPEVDIWHGLESLRMIAAKDRIDRETQIAQTLAEDLESGILGKALRAGSEAFVNGTDTSPEQEDLIGHALEVRILLSRAASLFASAGRDVNLLGDIVRSADEAHRHHGRALHIIDERTYERIVEDIPLDQQEWWGAKERLDKLVPPGVIEGLLAHDSKKSTKLVRFPVEKREMNADLLPVRLAAAAEGLATDLDALSDHSKSAAVLFTIAARLRTTPCPWLHAVLRDALDRALKDVPAFAPSLAQMIGPSPGRVPILLYHEATNTGFLAELWITECREQDVMGMWTQAVQISSSARDATRRAFFATGLLTPFGAPVRSFAEHKIELKLPQGSVLGNAELEIDGSSLGLPAALAFASLWTGRPIPRDVMATAAISGNNLGPVYGMAAKTKAVIAVVGGDPVRLLCHPVNEEEAQPIGVPLRTLEDALKCCEIDLKRLDPSIYGSVAERIRELESLLFDAKNQHLDRIGERTTWLDLADRMRRLISSLQGQPGAPSDMDEHRCYTALAYTHAGDVESATTLLQSLTHSTELTLPFRVIYLVMRIGLHIDCNTLETESGQADCKRLTSALSELRTHDVDGLLGRCCGAMGRALMHQGRLGESLPLLRDAVEYHGALASIYERARSRVYFAMALRMDGQSDAALEQLRLAEVDIKTHTRSFSEEYARSCTLFLLYEKARTLTSLGFTNEALKAADIALSSCAHLWWPQLGILRVRAWALRAQLREREADACVEHMLRVQHELSPPDMQSLVDDLITEARGDYVENGVVY